MAPCVQLMRRLCIRARLSWAWDNAELTSRERGMLVHWLPNAGRSAYVRRVLTEAAPNVN